MLTEREALLEILKFLWDAHRERSPKHPEQRQCPGCTAQDCWLCLLVGIPQITEVPMIMDMAQA